MPIEDFSIRLSDREIEVLELLANSASNREIADALFITQNTVKRHLSRIFDKLHTRSRQQAALLAIRKSIVVDAEAAENSVKIPSHTD